MINDIERRHVGSMSSKIVLVVTSFRSMTVSGPDTRRNCLENLSILKEL